MIWLSSEARSYKSDDATMTFILWNVHALHNIPCLICHLSSTVQSMIYYFCLQFCISPLLAGYSRLLNSLAILSSWSAGPQFITLHTLCCVCDGPIWVQKLWEHTLALYQQNELKWIGPQLITDSKLFNVLVKLLFNCIHLHSFLLIRVADL